MQPHHQPDRQPRTPSFAVVRCKRRFQPRQLMAQVDDAFQLRTKQFLHPAVLRLHAPLHPFSRKQNCKISALPTPKPCILSTQKSIPIVTTTQHYLTFNGGLSIALAAYTPPLCKFNRSNKNGPLGGDRLAQLPGGARGDSELGVRALVLTPRKSGRRAERFRSRSSAPDSWEAD